MFQQREAVEQLVRLHFADDQFIDGLSGIHKDIGSVEFVGGEHIHRNIAVICRTPIHVPLPVLYPVEFCILLRRYLH